MSEKYFTDDAVRIIAVTDPPNPTSVKVTLISPTGVVLLSEQAMSYDSTEKHWYYDWQPTSGGHGEGKYIFKVKTIKSTLSNIAKHFFYMEDV